MTHTSTEQTEALRLADALAERVSLTATGFGFDADLAYAAAELRRLHSRVQELEAAQAQRVPLTASQVAELLDEAGYSIWDVTRADFINGIRHGERAHGITQEKQG